MLLAADYPFLNVFWTMILFLFWVAWIWVLVGIVSDLFRRDDASGVVKALWVVGLIFLPFLGVLIYMIANGKGMAEREAARAQANRALITQYAAPAVSNGGAAGEIAQAKALLESGALTQPEFDALKAKALA